MGITGAADCRVNVVDVGRVEFFRREAPCGGDDEPRCSDRVGVGIVGFTRTNLGEEDARNRPLVFFFGWLAFMLDSKVSAAFAVANDLRWRVPSVSRQSA